MEKVIKSDVVKGIKGIAKMLLSCVPEIVGAFKEGKTKIFSFAFNTPEGGEVNSNNCSGWYGVVADSSREIFCASRKEETVLFVDYFGGCTHPMLITLPADATDEGKFRLVKEVIADLLYENEDYREDWAGTVVEDRFYCELTVVE